MVEKLPIPVAETIRKRRSVRTYEERPLSPEDRAKLVGYMGAVGNPFGVEVRLHIADRSVAAGGETLGTYGIIKGAGTFLGVSVPDTEPAPLAAGYQFECLVLCAADMGLGTVWLAATFDRPRFASAMGIRADELFPAAVDVVLELGQASVSMLQRRLKLGYSRAARLVDQMEEKGIVGPFEGSKPRALLITKEQWQEMKMGSAALPAAEEPPFPLEGEE